MVVHLYPGAGRVTGTAQPSRARARVSTDIARVPDVDPHDAEQAEVIEPLSPARAGFVVSKAVGDAVTRNRVKRRLRHLMRDRLSALPASSLIVVRALPPSAGADHARLVRDLDAALGRLGVHETGARL